MYKIQLLNNFIQWYDFLDKKGKIKLFFTKEHALATLYMLQLKNETIKIYDLENKEDVYINDRENYTFLIDYKQFLEDRPHCKHSLWQLKEQFMINMVSLFEPILEIKKRTDVGIPDIITPNCIYELKACLYVGFSKQKQKYEQLKKPVKFVVFEERGKTDISLDECISIKQIVEHDLLLQQQYENLLKVCERPTRWVI